MTIFMNFIVDRALTNVEFRWCKDINCHVISFLALLSISIYVLCIHQYLYDSTYTQTVHKNIYEVVSSFLQGNICNSFWPHNNTLKMKDPTLLKTVKLQLNKMHARTTTWKYPLSSKKSFDCKNYKWE